MDGTVIAPAATQRGQRAKGRIREGFGLGWGEVAERVETVLTDCVATAKQRSSSGPARELWDRIGDSLEGGKRLRPHLAWLAYAAFGGDDAKVCAAAGASFEFLHGALVVHDDVIDRDVVRRGRLNIAGVYGSEAEARGFATVDAQHVGNSVAIIAGDLLLAAAFRVMEGAVADPEKRARLLDLLHGAVTDAATGELADVLMAHSSGSMEEVLEMERLKTAVYSFEAPLRAGALLAGARDAEVDALGRVGSLIGVAYQAIDDVLGTFGDPRQTGKPVSSDLREGKLTVLTAFAGGDPDVAAHLGAARDRRDDLVREDLARDALHRAGADGYALSLAHALVTEALDEARSSDLPAALRSELTRLCNHLLHREH